MTKTKSKGLTLLEIILAVAIIAVIAVVTMPFFISLINKNKLDSTRLLAAQGVRRAMLKAQANEGNSDWGIYLTTGQIIIFRGSSYANRDVAYDVITPIEDNITFSGNTEIVFTRLTGELSATKTFNITATNTGEVKVISVNAKGAITY